MKDEYTCNANDAITLHLVGAPGSSSKPFHPEFTYPIFGEEETIYGYQDLSINLGFVSGNLIPLLHSVYGKKIPGTSAKIDAPESNLQEFLPAKEVLRCTSRADMEAKAAKAAGSFRPMGEKTASFKISSREAKGKQKSGSAAASGDSAGDDRFFEVYHCTWDTPGFKQWYHRMRIMTLLFIEAATYLDEAETNWEFYLLFERDTKDSSYHYVGFTSLYKFWVYPQSSRVRLSQFLILPPYQNLGLGTRLYTIVHDEMLRRGDAVTELTVEDPSEAFDRMRDGADLKRLLNPDALPDIAYSSERVKITSFGDGLREGKLLPPVDPAWSEGQRKAYKIPPRQWSRLVEMVQLMHIDLENEEQVKAYRLQVKGRIHKQNRDKLSQVSRNDRIRTLHERFEDIVGNEYSELIGVDAEPLLGTVELPEGDEDPEDDSWFIEEKKKKGKARASNGQPGRPAKQARHS